MALWRALRSRDRECAFVGCTRQGQQVHHVRHWAAGGETSARNTILACRRCHWLLHEGGFSVRGEAPNNLTFLDPHGRELTDRFEPPALPADPVAALRAEHTRRDLVIHDRTGSIDWWGEPLDLDAAVSGLLGHASGAEAPAGAETSPVLQRRPEDPGVALHTTVSTRAAEAEYHALLDWHGSCFSHGQTTDHGGDPCEDSRW